ncbi:MAG: hypothetical protein V4484_10735 [Pseudomonadota bacterium]
MTVHLHQFGAKRGKRVGNWRQHGGGELAGLATLKIYAVDKVNEMKWKRRLDVLSMCKFIIGLPQNSRFDNHQQAGNGIFFDGHLSAVFRPALRRVASLGGKVNTIGVANGVCRSRKGMSARAMVTAIVAAACCSSREKTVRRAPLQWPCT